MIPVRPQVNVFHSGGCHDQLHGSPRSGLGAVEGREACPTRAMRRTLAHRLSVDGDRICCWDGKSSRSRQSVYASPKTRRRRIEGAVHDLNWNLEPLRQNGTRNCLPIANYRYKGSESHHSKRSSVERLEDAGGRTMEINAPVSALELVICRVFLGSSTCLKSRMRYLIRVSDRQS
jgi:hypothetical protein